MKCWINNIDILEEVTNFISGKLRMFTYNFHSYKKLHIYTSQFEKHSKIYSYWILHIFKYDGTVEIGQKLVLYNGRFLGISGHVGTNHAWGEHGIRILLAGSSGIAFEPLGSTIYPKLTREIKSKKVQSKQKRANIDIYIS